MPQKKIYQSFVPKSSVKGQHGSCVHGNPFGRAGESSQQPGLEALVSPQRTVREETGGEGTLLLRQGTELSTGGKPMGSGDCVEAERPGKTAVPTDGQHTPASEQLLPQDKIEALFLWGWYHM